MDNSIFEIDCSRLPIVDQLKFMEYLDSGYVTITVKGSVIEVLETKLSDVQRLMKRNKENYKKNIKYVNGQLSVIRALVSKANT